MTTTMKDGKMEQKQLTDNQYYLLMKLALDFNAGIIALATVWQGSYNKKRFINEYQKRAREYQDGIERILEME